MQTFGRRKWEHSRDGGLRGLREIWSRGEEEMIAGLSEGYAHTHTHTHAHTHTHTYTHTQHTQLAFQFSLLRVLPQLHAYRKSWDTRKSDTLFHTVISLACGFVFQLPTPTRDRYNRTHVTKSGKSCKEIDRTPKGKVRVCAT